MYNFSTSRVSVVIYDPYVNSGDVLEEHAGQFIGKSHVTHEGNIRDAVIGVLKR